MVCKAVVEEVAEELESWRGMVNKVAYTSVLELLERKMGDIVGGVGVGIVRMVVVSQVYLRYSLLLEEEVVGMKAFWLVGQRAR